MNSFPRSARVRLALLVACLFLAQVGAAHATPSLAILFRIRLHAERGVTTDLRYRIAERTRELHEQIGRDYGLYPTQLTIKLFATHRSFARALWAEQRQRPQSQTDASSSIVRNTLLLGPLPPSYLWHNLAHVYTEWLIDRVTGNASDALPSDPWLYDGLAEYEAFQYAPAGLHCSGGGSALLDVTAIRTAQQWMALRAGPFGSLEYCLAYLRVRHIVNRSGWACVTRALHDRRGWIGAAARLRKMGRTGGCARF